MNFAIKKNSETSDTELWIDGKFHASWASIPIPESSFGILGSMLQCAYDHGRDEKTLEIRKVLGIRR